MSLFEATFQSSPNLLHVPFFAGKQTVALGDMDEETLYRARLTYAYAHSRLAEAFAELEVELGVKNVTTVAELSRNRLLDIIGYVPISPNA